MMLNLVSVVRHLDTKTNEGSHICLHHRGGFSDPHQMKLGMPMNSEDKLKKIPVFPRKSELH